MKNHIEGLFLWNVKLSGTDNSLWITTKKNDTEAAAKKAKAFLRKKKNTVEYCDSQVVGIEGHGTLDA